MLSLTTGGQIVQACRTLARIYPNRKSGDSCYYVVPDDDHLAGYDAYNYPPDHLKPKCIVGHALVMAGIPKDSLAQENSTQIKELRLRLKNHGLSISDEDMFWLVLVQMEQDKDYCWASAVRRADEEMKYRV